MSLRGYRDRLKRIESRTPATSSGGMLGPRAQAIKDCDRHIAELTKEIEEIEAQMSPEELARSREWERIVDEELTDIIGQHGWAAAIAAIDERIANIRREIHDLEALSMPSDSESDKGG